MARGPLPQVYPVPVPTISDLQIESVVIIAKLRHTVSDLFFDNTDICSSHDPFDQGLPGVVLALALADLREIAHQIRTFAIAA
ncbi:hypothetical protein FGB62_87g086 [Gracilaria domingensis]|nr:hypothetical protein FGB62_87g086 [Gracilaria domingensis]